MEHLCECGCGEETKSDRRFIRGHNRRGKNQSEEARRKMSIGRTGKVISKEHRANLSKAGKGRVVSPETRAKISIAQIGKIIPAVSRLKMSEAHKGVKLSEKHVFNRSLAQMKSSLKHGYCHAWGDIEYKNSLRGEACENCGITNMMSLHLFGSRLATHHKNGKLECSPTDIQTLCMSCHIKLHHALRRAA